MTDRDLSAKVSQESVIASISDLSCNHCSLFCGPSKPEILKHVTRTVFMNINFLYDTKSTDTKIAKILKRKSIIYMYCILPCKSNKAYRPNAHK